MKANELMIGDWVKLTDEECTQTYGECTQITGVRLNEEDAPNITINCNETYFEGEFDFIPLTEEILEANGFEPTYDHLWVYRTDEDWFQFYHNNSAHYFFIPSTGVSMHIKYVHELQHALRLCELNDLADNFKIN